MSMPVDTERSWVFLGACFYMNFIIYGIGRLSGIFFVESMSKFNVGRTAASFPYTFCAFVECLSGPLIGYLGHKFGIHKILIIGSLFATFGLGACSFVENIGFISLFYGLIFGLGGGSVLLVPVLINMHFYKYRAVASGIRTVGSPCGSFILPPVTEILLGKYDLSGTFLILTGLVFNCLPATLLMWSMKSDSAPVKHSTFSSWKDTEKQPMLKDDKTAKVYSESASTQKNWKYNEKNFYSSDKEDEIIKNFPKEVLGSSESVHSPPKNSNMKQKVTFRNVFTDPVFICLALQTAFYAFINKSFMTVIVDFASDLGLTDQEQAYTLVLFSTGELIGPLCLGWIVDKSYFKKTTFLAFACFSQAIMVVIITLSNGSIMLFSILVAMGFVNSAQVFVLPLLLPEYIPEDRQTLAMPSIPFLSAPGTLLVSPLIGVLREGLGSYVYMFYILGIFSAACGMIFLIIECLSKRKSKA